MQVNERRRVRQMMVFQAAQTIRDHLGGSSGPLEERMEHVRIAALGAVCDARAVFIALRAKGIISESEEQLFLDSGYKAVLDQITGALNQVGIQEVGRG